MAARAASDRTADQEVGLLFQNQLFHSLQGFADRHARLLVPRVDNLDPQRPFDTAHAHSAGLVDLVHGQLDAFFRVPPMQVSGRERSPQNNRVGCLSRESDADQHKDRRQDHHQFCPSLHSSPSLMKWAINLNPFQVNSRSKVRIP